VEGPGVGLSEDGAIGAGELLSKLSSYNLFNYLLPGVIFGVLAGKTAPNPIAART
jgi:hypothetical protein